MCINQYFEMMNIFKKRSLVLELEILQIRLVKCLCICYYFISFLDIKDIQILIRLIITLVRKGQVSLIVRSNNCFIFIHWLIMMSINICLCKLALFSLHCSVLPILVRHNPFFSNEKQSFLFRLIFLKFYSSFV